MNNNYARACKEVSEILKYISMDYIEKIPLEVLDVLNQKMDKNYEFQYDINKEYEEQNLLVETKAILANIYIDYWATEEQRERIKEIHNEDRRKIDLLKYEKYNPNELFKNKKSIQNIEITQLVEGKELSIIQKIMNNIKNLFRKS